MVDPQEGPPLIFRPNWGPKGQEHFFRDPPPPLYNLPLLIWRSGSATAVVPWETCLNLKFFFSCSYLLMFFNVVPQEALILLDLEFFNKMTAVISLMVSFILCSCHYTFLSCFKVQLFSHSSLISSCFNQVPVKSSVEIYQEHWSQGRRCRKILMF